MFREMKKFIILIPVYNDWKSLFKLLENINREISNQSNRISVLVVNDKSTEEIANNTINFSNLDYVRIINLKKMVVMVMQSQLALNILMII